MNVDTIAKILGILVAIFLVFLIAYMGIGINEGGVLEEKLEETNSFKECFNFCKNFDTLVLDISEKKCLNECEHKILLEEAMGE